MLTQNIRSGLISVALGISSILLSSSVLAAERITFNFSPLGQFKIRVKDLEAFALGGEISSELAVYLNRLPPQQLAKLPELLSTPLELDPLTISKFSNSSVGEAVIKNFGKGIRVDSNLNGFYALRGAMIAAAFDQEGLTIINLLQQFPSDTIHLDLNVLTQYLERGTTLAQNREAIYQTWFSDEEQSSGLKKHAAKALPQEDLTIPGQYSWSKNTIAYKNPRRPRPGYFDLYQPITEHSVPLVVISHGVASSRQTFAYLGKHLSSYGFAVAIIEHDEISLNKFDRFLAGRERFPEPNNLIDQPLDVTSVLDQLEQETNINLQQVGILGQSFGGYTSLALAGGELITEDVPIECKPDDYHHVFLDLSSLAKCTVSQFNQSPIKLKDPRIKATIAINPMAKIFGQAGISAIDVPTMIIAGTNDMIMPPVAEQIKPFSWLNKNLDKYLVLVKPGTHFSFLQEGLGVLPVPDSSVGPSPSSAHPTLKAMSTAFFQMYLNQQTAYQSYFEQDYLNQLSNNAFELAIIRFIRKSQLKEILN